MTYFALSGLINAALSTVLGVYVFFQGRTDARHKTYALYCLSLAVWSYFYFLWLLSDTPEEALLFCRLLMLGAIFIPVTHYHHIIALFGQERPHHRTLVGGYFLATAFAVSDSSRLFVAGVHPNEVFPFWPTPGPFFLPYLLYFFIYLFLSMKTLYQVYGQSSAVRKTQIQYITAATLIGYVGGSTNFPLWYGIPIPPYGNILVSLYAGVVAYILIKHHLLDVHTIVRKGLTYGLTLLLILLPLFVIALLAQAYFFGGISYAFSALLLATFVMIALAFYHLKRKIETAVSRSFFTTSYETTQSLTALSQAVIQMLDMKEIGDKLACTIATAMGARSSMLFMRDASGYFRLFAAHPGEGSLPANGGVSQEHPVCQVMNKHGLVLREEVPRFCSQEEAAVVQKFFDTRDFTLVVAFLAPSEQDAPRLVGFCGVSEKEGSQRPYQAEELKYLEALSSQAAIAMENARLHQFHLDAQRQLDRINRLQGIEDVVTGLSHEIRNPLTSIKMFLQLLPQIKHQEEFISKYYQAAVREMARIERLITELIALSRPKEPRLRRQSLNVILESVLVLMGPKCRDRSISLKTDLQETLPHILLDEDKIRQVLLNLILNAVEAVEKNGSITLSTRLVISQEEPFVRLAITDTGRGIPAEDIERIFTPFYSTKPKRSEREGVGVGLAIVHRLVREHSGVISVESDPTRGTTFVVMLPVQIQTAGSDHEPELRKSEMGGISHAEES